MTSLMTDWYENKKKYIEWFGDKLIFEYGPVEFHLDKERKQSLVKEFLEQAGNILMGTEFEQLSTFILKNMSSFFDNTVTCGENPVKSGMKLSKAFKYFIKNKDALNTVQQIASMYIQKDKVSGTLCFSVHPLDYLSLSENTYNWRSCHSLDGDYRAGNLSYMCDPSTIICYIKGDKEEKLPNFPTNIPWNSKKWRMLIFFDEMQDYCFLGRQYPYALENIFSIIQNEILPGSFSNFSDFNMESVPDIGRLWDKMIILNTRDGYKPFGINEVIEDDSDSPLHYNDLLYSTVYTPYYSSKRHTFEIKSKFPKIKVGHEVKCLCCGTGTIYASEALMTCKDCAAANGLALPDDYVYCADCGNPYPEDEIYYTANGDPICEYCLNNGNWITCCNCGEIYFYDETIYSEKYDSDFCNNCFDNIKEEEYAYRRANRLED